MSEAIDQLVRAAVDEWRFFGQSLRSLDDDYTIIGEEFLEPYCSRIGDYWKSVDEPLLNGRSDQPWSGAFISWCFAQMAARGLFPGSARHSVYIDRIRRHPAAGGLTLMAPGTTPVAVGDLIWNARRTKSEPKPPRDHDEALARLAVSGFFPSHVDIVVAVGNGRCDSIGGNISNRKSPSGSVTRSTWLVGPDGQIVDPRKSWLGVVKNRF